MYQKNTLVKYRARMEAAIKEARADIENRYVCISKGNKKIGRCMNVSTAAIFTCGNCKECKWLCYDIKAANMYKNVLNARANNTAILRYDRARYFDEIEKAINKRRKNKFFRWHVSGEILDQDYFENMVEIARRHPDFVFWTYTKMYHIVNKYVENHGGDRACIPSNFSIMFSEWRGMPMENKYNFPEFKVVFKDETPPAGFYCPGNCDICKEKNLGCIAGCTTYCKEH